jgi:hypothetical protein
MDEYSPQNPQLAWFLANLRILRAAQGCGASAPHGGRLVHHHTDPATKKYNVSKMAYLPLEAFIDEIAKCEVLCMSHHTRFHKTR